MIFDKHNLCWLPQEGCNNRMSGNNINRCDRDEFPTIYVMKVTAKFGDKIRTHVLKVQSKKEMSVPDSLSRKKIK